MNKKFTNKKTQMLKKIKKVIKNKNENKVKEKTKNKIMRVNNNLKKNSNLNIYQEKSFQTSSKILDLKILGEGNFS